MVEALRGPLSSGGAARFAACFQSKGPTYTFAEHNLIQVAPPRPVPSLSDPPPPPPQTQAPSLSKRSLSPTQNTCRRDLRGSSGGCA